METIAEYFDSLERSLSNLTKGLSSIEVRLKVLEDKVLRQRIK